MSDAAWTASIARAAGRARALVPHKSADSITSTPRTRFDGASSV